jgi:hypothetical protein
VRGTFATHTIAPTVEDFEARVPVPEEVAV